MSTNFEPHDDARAGKLAKFFDLTLSGKQPLQTSQNGNLFIEAVCAQPDHATCINKLVTSPKGLSSLQACMRFNTSTTFFNGSATLLFKYIQVPTLKSISGGDLLSQVVLHIVEPPIFWKPFLQAYKDDGLTDDAQHSFGWLLLELISLPGDKALAYYSTAQDPLIQTRLLNSAQFAIRTVGQKIKHVLSSLISPCANEDGPGGRHDNDFPDFRQISILPTADELASEEPPFLRIAQAIEDPENQDSRLAIHLDNQYRLLREDMLGEIREELQIALGQKKGRHRGLVMDGFTPVGISCGTNTRRYAWGMQLESHVSFNKLFKAKVEAKDRKAYLTANRNVFKHQSLACLILDGEVAAFPAIYRDEDLLAKNSPIVVLQFASEPSTSKTILKLRVVQNIRLVQIDTAVFSFEPVLQRLKEIKTMPLSDELLHWNPACSIHQPPSPPQRIIRSINDNPSQSLQDLLDTRTPINLDPSQRESLLMGLTQNLSLIQGPPGTGKSFIGALLAKILHGSTSKTMLVVCYTNHALDQFLEDLLNIGIPAVDMVRLGGKSTPRTKCLALSEQAAGKNLNRDAWKIIDELKSKTTVLADRLQDRFNRYRSANVQKWQLMEHLEFPPEDPTFYQAFKVPGAQDGMTNVGKGGRAVNQYYLLDRWSAGNDAGIFKGKVTKTLQKVWAMPFAARKAALERWKLELLKEQASLIYETAAEYNDYQRKLERMFNARNAQIIRGKRIIGCTTTAAAKYAQEVQSAQTDVLLVEEAGEILESHILTALGAETKQLVLIGDHKQLRPKINNYNLQVEKGEGFDLDRSLFERLVLKGFPHRTLSEQHRMRPEISALIRHLTYPDLIDAPKTRGRPNLRGFQSNVIFVNHDHPEDDNPLMANHGNAKGSSKQNRYEAEMVLKCVRYLAQQGYGTEKIVILTPYLAQLHLLREILGRENDPILNDLDSYDLVRAGLVPAASARLAKRPIRISSIDNYQGEESEIVVITMTRSNASRDIGFMASSERLNVLLSRARNALIMIGNAETFINARKGKDIWVKFFDLMKREQHVFDGFPVKCERHPERMCLLSRAVDFEEECPDGGCKEPCGTILKCTLHSCPQRCHQLYDHSKMPCDHVMHSQCPKGHTQSWKCHSSAPASCRKCESDAKLQEKKQRRDFEIQQKREEEQRDHLRQMALMDEKIELERQRLQDAQSRKEREHALQQKMIDLANAVALTSRSLLPSPQSQHSPKTDGHTIVPPNASSSTTERPKSDSPRTRTETTLRPLSEQTSPAKEEWQRQKDVENANNSAVDSIMEMIGLEDVKTQVLRIKAKIDTTLRQHTDLKGERFGVVLLGNPGTGKTTVARLYAKLLTSLGVLPGSAFIETTGSRLAQEGVAGAKNLIEKIHNAGGGAFFLDEAYQLTASHNYGGGQVLDFLLAEIENNVGKIIFILAGYNKQMEKFFEHNPGLTSRIPYSLQFGDYSDDELLCILCQHILKKYNGKMDIEDGERGLYMRIAVRRLGRGRDREGFGNARALQNLFSKISERQAERLARERKGGVSPDDFYLSKEDLIGPDPSEAIIGSEAWRKLQELIGLDTVKETIRTMIDRIQLNYKRELQEKPPIEVSLNRVFLGSPGTGKTSVAKLYGRILADLGLLSNGEVVLKNPADFIGNVIGQSESNTKAILATTVGKVLIIDEVYMLYSGAGTGNQNDSYKTAVIDTIVAEIQSVPGEDRCVLLLGYEDKIIEMFQNVNPGLSRRFAIEDAFHFQDFTSPQLRKILDLKLKLQGLDATEEAKSVADEVLGRARRRPNFGNAGEVENLLSKAKLHHQSRQSRMVISERSVDVVFEPQDFDMDFDRGLHADINCRKLFEDIIGCESIIAKLEGYQQIARNMKARGMDPHEQIPTNFIFKGPPGTGKTTTARKMGQVYYDMGFLSHPEVVECSASDLIGQYVGQTGPKTQKQLEGALGKVLFVDEAYRLGEGHFATEAINEMVDLLTKSKYCGKLIVILAGYDADMNKLVAVNTGLSSRFPEEIIFHNMTPEHCLHLLNQETCRKGIQLASLQDSTSPLYTELLMMLNELSSLPSWGNARDVQTLGKSMIGFAFKQSGSPDSPPTLSSEEVINIVKTMLSARKSRCATTTSKDATSSFPDMAQMLDSLPPVPPAVSSAHETNTTSAQEETMANPKKHSKETAALPAPNTRDAGVSDEVWNQLQADLAAEDRAAQLSLSDLQNLESTLRLATVFADSSASKANTLAQTTSAHDSALKRQQEEARLDEQNARLERARALDAFEKAQHDARERKQREARAQAKLQEMGVCVAGYRWVRQGGGWRCKGGSHFVGDSELGM